MKISFEHYLMKNKCIPRTNREKFLDLIKDIFNKKILLY